MIHATIAGRLGQDARKIDTQDGASFSVATVHGYGESKVTTWVDVTLWGKRGATLLDRGMLPKGAAVVVRGELWAETGKNGKTYIKMRADEVQLIGGREGGSAAPAYAPPAAPVAAAPVDPDDLPF